MFYISESDLKLLDAYYDGIHEQNPDYFLNILRTNGMDTNKKIELKEDTHRNLQKKVHTGKRWVGEERCDKQWLRSGFASVEAYINSSDDKSFQDELRGMSREGTPYEKYKDMVERAHKTGVLN